MDSRKIKKRPNLDGNNCDVPKKKLLKKNCTFVKQKTTIKESVTKRKAADELIGYENKKKCRYSNNYYHFRNYLLNFFSIVKNFMQNLHFLKYYKFKK